MAADLGELEPEGKHQSMGAKKYDVLIVGAGPAGSTLAYQLARQGVDTLIVERDVLPRYKT